MLSRLRYQNLAQSTSKQKSVLVSENVSFLYTEEQRKKKRFGIRILRWGSVIFINLLFFFSYHFDLQILEGTLIGSRMLGFHLIDPFVTLQMFLAHWNLHINLIIGVLTIVFFYIIVGGRAFCSWVCPYGLLGESAEFLHKYLVSKKIIKSYKFDYRIKYIFWLFFLFLAFFAGYLVYEIVNPVGIVSRAVVYGGSIAVSFVIALLLVEIFFSQRFWCRYVCPTGTTYSFLGWLGATKIKWNEDKCNHCNACSKACITPHVLRVVKEKNEKKSEKMIISGDCTLCGRCIEACDQQALSYATKLKSLI